MEQVNLKEAFDKYNNSLNSGCVEDIEKAKYKLLWESSNFFELVVNYIALD